MEDIFYHKDFLYIPEIIYSKIISHHHNDPLASYYGIKKTKELIVKKNF